MLNFRKKLISLTKDINVAALDTYIDLVLEYSKLSPFRLSGEAPYTS